MTEKLIGYILLITGLLIIIFSGFSVYQVFTKKTTPTDVFDFSGIILDTSDMAGIALPNAEILPAEVLNGSLNYFAYLFFMGFIASIGYKISSLGVNLIRPIIIKAKDEKNKKEIISQ